MLTISGLRNFYFLPNMTDMRCGYNRIMEIVRTVYGRDPYDGDVYFYMSKNQRTVRMVNFEHGIRRDIKTQVLQRAIGTAGRP